MKEQRLLRAIGEIDNELILEADTVRFPPKRWGHWLALAACIALVISVPFLLPGKQATPKEPAEELCGAPLPPYKVSEEGLFLQQYDFSTQSWQATILEPAAAQALADLMYEGEDIGSLGELPATVPTDVLDFRNGTYVILYGLDTAIIKQYDTVFETPPLHTTETPPEARTTLRRHIPGLDEAVELALAKSSGINLGGLRPGMTQEEVTALVGDPVLVKEAEQTWFYGSYYLHFAGPDGMLTSILTGGGCQLTLESGIGLGSTEEAVAAAYPNHIIGSSVDAVSYHISTDTAEVMIETQDGIVTFITLSVGQDRLRNALTVPYITIHASASEGWMVVTAIDKAAKKICTTMTISEPEPAQRPEGNPTDWMDFRNGIAVGLYDGDYAVVYQYAGTFDPDNTENLHPYLEGVFSGLDDAFLNALRNPTETWDDQSEAAPEMAAEIPEEEPG